MNEIRDFILPVITSLCIVIKVLLRYRSNKLLGINISKEDLKGLKYYVPTHGQINDPCYHNDYDNSRIKLTDFFIKDVFKKDKYGRYFIILADSGMGKSTFLQHLFLKYNRKLIKSKKVLLYPLTNGRDLGLLKNLDERSQKILLLDALDEDSAAIHNYHERITEIIESTQDFYKVIITCRTQFFPDYESEPENIHLIAYGTNSKKLKFKKFYISPFSNNDIELYLLKKYKYNKYKRGKAKQIIQKSPDLMARPMLLAYVDDLIDIQYNYCSITDIYGVLVKKWLQREPVKYELLEKFTNMVTKYMFDHDLASIPINVIERLCDKEEIETLEPLLARTRSLLNRNSVEYKFAHKSIYEYLISYNAIYRDHSMRKKLNIIVNRLDGAFDSRYYSELIYKILIENNPSLEYLDMNILDNVDKNDMFLEKNMQGFNFRGSNLSQYNLTKCNLAEADLSESCLTNCKLSYANLSNANLVNADLENMDLSGAKLIEADLTNVNLTKADLSYANLTKANLTNADLAGAIIAKAELSNINLVNADLTGADLTKSNLEHANLENAILTDTHFAKADLSNVDLTVTSLKNSDNMNLLFNQTVFKNAKLNGIRFINAVFIDSDFTNSDLTGTDLTGVNFVNATLTNAIFDKNTILRSAIFDSSNITYLLTRYKLMFDLKDIKIFMKNIYVDFSNYIFEFYDAIINKGVADSVSEYLIKVFCNFIKSDYCKCVRYCDKILEIEPDNYLAYFYKGNSYYKMHYYEDALDYYDKAIGLQDHDKAIIYLNMGNVFFEMKDFKKAADHYSYVIELTPYNDIAYYNRSKALNKRMEYTRAADDLVLYRRWTSITNNLYTQYRIKEPWELT